MKESCADSTFVPYLIHNPETMPFSIAEKIKIKYQEKGREYFFKLAKESKILPFAAHTFCFLGCDSNYWNGIHQHHIERNSLIEEIIDHIFKRFDQFGIETICLFENFGTVLSAGSCLGCFCSGDVDLTADIENEKEISAVLDFFNFKKEEENRGIFNNVSSYHHRSMFEKGFRINIVWEPVGNRLECFNKACSLRLRLERMHAKKLPNESIRVLQNNALLYFSILHIASGHFYTMQPGLRLYVDIDRLIRNCEIQWEKILQWATEDRIGPRSDMVLSICSKILNTPIPEKAFTPNVDSNAFKKLFFFLIEEKNYTFKEHNNLYHRAYVEILSEFITTKRGRCN